MNGLPELVPLTQKIQSLFQSDGSCPYYKGGGASAEATILAFLALWAIGTTAEQAKLQLSWISGLQNSDGSVGVDASHRDQGIWLTAPAAIAFHWFGLKSARDKALNFLTALKSVTVPNEPNLKQDNTLTGWPWVAGTFGWVEPTAWAVMALSLAGLGGQPRAVEGRKFLLDRQIPSGGWNYGNPNVNDQELLPFWDTTGLALLALFGKTDGHDVRVSLDLLERKQDRIESLSGLAWSVLSLSTYGRATGRLKERLLAAMHSALGSEVNAANFALGLIALSGKKVFAP